MSVVSAPQTAAEAASREAAAARRAADVPQTVSWAIRTLLGLLLMALGTALLYMVVALWPAVQPAATPASDERTISWFGWSHSVSADSALLTLVILVSALGSFVHAAISFSDYVGNRQLARSWIWWYLLRVLVGASLAVLFYFAVRGGFLAAGTDAGDINPYGMAALAGLVGLFSKQAADKLREIFDTAFRVAPGRGDDARADSIANPVPTLEGSEPHRLAATDLEIVLVGSGFVTGSVVRVARADGSDVPRDVTLLGPQRLRVLLDRDDVASPGLLLFSVVNPEPGGGVSRPLPVWVDASGDGAGAEEVAPDR